MNKTHACCLCGSLRNRRQYSYKDYDLCRCEECGLGFLLPMPEIVAEQFYDEEFYRGGVEVGVAFNVLDEQNMNEHRLGMEKKISSLLSKRTVRSLLDIGCGVGLLVEAATRHGINATGVDVSSFAIEYGRHELGLQRLFVGNPDDVLDSCERYDVVYLNHVIEHVHDPAELVKQCSKYLEPGGWLVIEVPDIDSTGALRKGRDWECILPAHLYYFNRSTLSALAEKQGLKVKYVEKEIDSPGFLHAACGGGGEAKEFYERWLKNAFAQLCIRQFRAVYARVGQKIEADYEFIKVVAEKKC